MALVSISEASKLTGKSRTTLHRHIRTGKLSKLQDDTGNYKLDTSELIRVYGALSGTPVEQPDTVSIEQHDTLNDTLKRENEQLKKQIDLLQDHVSSLKQALVLIEYKTEQGDTAVNSDVTSSKPPKRRKFLGIF